MREASTTRRRVKEQRRFATQRTELAWRLPRWAKVNRQESLNWQATYPAIV